MRREKVLRAVAVLLIICIFAGYSTVVNAKYNMTYLYGTGDYIALVENTKDTLDEVSPSYFDVGSNGKLVINTIDKNFVDAMHDKGIKVVPFFSNHWNRERGVAMFSQAETVVTELVNAVNENNLDGVNVDIENMTEGSRKWYVDFVKLLREKMPEEKIVAVSVAANPKGWTTGWHGSYDYAELGKYADYLMIMAYDEHYEGGEAGSVASYEFIEESIKHALKHVTKDKIVLGLPLYARYWKVGATSGGAAASYIQVQNLISKYDSKVTYDSESKSMKAAITIKEADEKPKIYGKTLDAGEYEFWYENDDTIKEKLELINTYDLKGAGTWRLGMENVSMWDVFKEVLKTETEEVKKKRFKDVTEDYWAKDAINTLADKGIINGRSVDEFEPEGNMTRAEFVTILDRFIQSSNISLEKLETSENKSKFSDINSHWASESIEKMTQNGLLNGYPDGTFRPDEPINRAESAEILYKIIQKMG
ncbi:MAG: S-layer homology domain-containing protein [Clostridia bacterium]|nr:S-layer homology domain-containing protein [Clostridia bacterium]